MNYSRNDVTAIILAGGLGRRLNNKNKGLISLAGKTLIEHIIDRLKPQTPHIIINANQDLSRYQSLDLPVIEDTFSNNQGPLAGILSCYEHIKTPLVMTIPCDAPLLPTNLLDTMLKQYLINNPSQLCVVDDGKRLQNLFMMFHIKQFAHLEHFYQQNNRKVSDWIESQTYTKVDFSNQESKFININTEKTLSSLINKLNSDAHE